MVTALTFPIQTYNALLGRCLRTSREYALLRNGVIRHGNAGDGHESGIVHLLCDAADAQRIFALAADYYPIAVSQIYQHFSPNEVADHGPYNFRPARASQHLLQVYEADDRLLDMLENFVGVGLLAGQSVIAIATPQHLEAIEARLQARIDLERARKQDAYIPVDADQTLGTFMVDGWPDENLFDNAVGQLLRRGRGRGREVRAFGEMVALLWDRGQQAAALRLEQLWDNLRRVENFSLLCAYPNSAFASNATAPLESVRGLHSQAISGNL